MLILLHNGMRVATRGRTPVTYEKIEKRWYLVYHLRGTRGKEPCKVPVKQVKEIRNGADWPKEQTMT